MKILFMGTPDFAKIIFEGIRSLGADVVAVVTQPDKRQGRKMLLTPPPVKAAAQEAGIPVYQPETLRGGAFAQTLKEINPDLIAVAAYGKILPEEILSYPKYGCVNVHTSLLPKYRGAAPMQRAIMEGESETGVTIMYMAQGLDTGDILKTEKTPIYDNDNLETLHDRLAQMGSKLLWETICDAEAEKLTPVKQKETDATYAAKIEKADCVIDFNKSAKEVFNKIRALSPAPLAFTKLNGKTVKIISAEEENIKGRPGEVTSIDDGKRHVACAQGGIAIQKLIPEGKGRMSAADFIRGRKVAAGDIMGK